MTIDEGIEYLAKTFSGHVGWAERIRQACEEYRTDRKTVSFLNRPHVSPPVHVRATAAQDAAGVFRTLLSDGRLSAPCNPLVARPVRHGGVDILLPCDPIVRLVDSGARRIYNVTLPSHVFFPGFVRVDVLSKGDGTWVEVNGEGMGEIAWFNEKFGPALFRMLISHVPGAYEKEKKRAR